EHAKDTESIADGPIAQAFAYAGVAEQQDVTGRDSIHPPLAQPLNEVADMRPVVLEGVCGDLAIELLEPALGPVGERERLPHATRLVVSLLEPREISERESTIQLPDRLVRKRLVVVRDHDASALLDSPHHRASE